MEPVLPSISIGVIKPLKLHSLRLPKLDDAYRPLQWSSGGGGREGGCLPGEKRGVCQGKAGLSARGKRGVCQVEGGVCQGASV